MTRPDPAALDIDGLRRWEGREETVSGIVTPWLAEAFAATLDRPAAARPGDPALPGLHWCVALSAAPMAALGPDGHPARGGFLPPVPLPRRMWAGGRLDFTGDLRVGDEVTRSSTVRSVEAKQGRTGPLVFVLVEHRLSTARGPAVTEEHDIVYRGLDAVGGTAPAASPPAAGDAAPATAVRTIVPDPVLLFRYSALTFNGHRIHYDRDYVTTVEGYPGLIVHGPLQATLLMNLAVDVLGAPLAAFSFRAERALFDLAPFTIEAERQAEGATLRVRDAGGRTTMRASAR